jgi:hypothetical protein
MSSSFYLQLHHENCIHLHILHVIKVTKLKSSNLQGNLIYSAMKQINAEATGYCNIHNIQLPDSGLK